MKKLISSIVTASMILLFSYAAFAQPAIEKPFPLITNVEDFVEVRNNSPVFTTSYAIGDIINDTKNISMVSSKDVSGLLMINGTFQKKAFPVNESGTNLVPIRVISENLGFKVDYSSADKTITVSNNSAKIELKLGEKTATVNGDTVSVSQAPKLINGVTYVPLRFIAENMGLKVGYDKTVIGFPIVWVAENFEDSYITVSEPEALQKLTSAIKEQSESSDMLLLYGEGVFDDVVSGEYDLKNSGENFGRFWQVSVHPKNNSNPNTFLYVYLIDKYTGVMFVSNKSSILDNDYLFSILVAG